MAVQAPRLPHRPIAVYVKENIIAHSMQLARTNWRFKFEVREMAMNLY